MNPLTLSRNFWCTGWVLCGLIALASTGWSQDLGHKAAPQKSPIVLSGGVIHTVSGDIIPGGFIEFENGIIQRVGSGPVGDRAGVQKLDVTGLHIYPGLIHPYTQLGMKEISSLSDPTDVEELGSRTPEVRATVTVNPDSTVIPVSRSNGILLAGVFPTGGLISGRAGMIRLDGWTTADMTVLRSAGLVINWPNIRSISASWMKDSAGQQRKKSREEMLSLTDYFDQALAYYKAKAAGIRSEADIRFDSIRGIFPADSGAQPEEQVFVVAQDFDQLVSSVQVARRYGWRLVLIGAEEADLCLPMLRENQVKVILLNTHRLPRREDSDYDEAWKLPLRLQDSGVTWCLGNQEMFGNERNLPYHAGAAVGFGLTPDQAIRSISLSVAEVFGIEKNYGSLEVGKSATLIVTTGSPLEIMSEIRLAFIDGRQIDLSSKHTRLRDKYEAKYQQLGPYPVNAAPSE